MRSAVLRAIFSTWARVSSSFAEASMPRTRRGRFWPANPCDHPGLRGPCDGADDDRVEEDAEFLLLLLHLVGPVGEAQSAQSMVGRSGRDGVGDTAGRADLFQRVLPAFLEPDAEAGLDQFDLGAHDPRQQDVADPVVHRIRPVDPTLLHQARLQP
jgi:hypothetical protein